MRIFINAMPSPTGQWGGALLNRFKTMGLAGIRFDVTTNPSLPWEASLSELADHPELDAVFLLFGGKMTKGGATGGEPWDNPAEMVNAAATWAEDIAAIWGDRITSAVELGNEPDLSDGPWKKDPRGLGNLTNEMFLAVREKLPKIQILCGGVSNLIKHERHRGLVYLESMLRVLHIDVGVAFHRYPVDFFASPHISHRNFNDRNEEFARLMDLAAGREVWCTETGKSQYDDKHDPHSEETQADYIASDLQFNRDRGLQNYVLYNINSGPNARDPEHGYGIRHLNEPWDGDWKVIGQRLPDLCKEFA